MGELLAEQKFHVARQGSRIALEADDGIGSTVVANGLDDLLLTPMASMVTIAP